jgi:hypothetical protein
MLEATPFRGTSRSFTTQPAPRRYIECPRCGTSLHGRLEGRSCATVKGVRCLVERFVCRCGTARSIRRALST